MFVGICRPGSFVVFEDMRPSQADSNQAYQGMSRDVMAAVCFLRAEAVGASTSEGTSGHVIDLHVLRPLS